MNIAALMAGGTGERMGKQCSNFSGSDLSATEKSNKMLPKQFLTLDSEPIIIKTLSIFIKSGLFDAFYIGIHPDWADFTEKLLKNTPITSKNASIHVVSGGKDRNTTLQNVLSAIENDLRDAESSDQADISEFAADLGPGSYGIDPIIVTHDAVRPFITAEMIEKSIEAASAHGAATLAIPTTDTIGATQTAGAPASVGTAPTQTAATNTPSTPALASILDRSTLYNIQTPQTFRLSAFRDAYSALTQDQISSLTDVCGIFTCTGHTVAIVPGDPKNIKITTPFDLDLAKIIL